MKFGIIIQAKLFEDVKPLQEQKPQFVHIATWGCQMNDHDSEVMRALLEQSGLVWTDAVEEADVVVLNTCSVRKSAEQKVIGFLGALKHLKESRPEVIVAVGGCMIQNQEIMKQLRKSGHVNIIFGTRSFHRLPSLISSYNKNQDSGGGNGPGGAASAARCRHTGTAGSRLTSLSCMGATISAPTAWCHMPGGGRRAGR